MGRRVPGPGLRLAPRPMLAWAQRQVLPERPRAQRRALQPAWPAVSAERRQAPRELPGSAEPEEPAEPEVPAQEPVARLVRVEGPVRAPQAAQVAPVVVQVQVVLQVQVVQAPEAAAVRAQLREAAVRQPESVRAWEPRWAA
jgi:hypothetical protein